MLDEEKLISREELAAQCGLSVAEIRRREGLGQFKPSMRVKRNRPLYHPRVVAQILHGLKRKRDPIPIEAIDYRKDYPYTAADAALLFKAFSEKKSLDAIVMTMGFHPGTVRAASMEYAEMAGALFVDGVTMKEINGLDLDGNFPLPNGEALLDVLKGCASTDCVHCKKRPKAVCVDCVPALADKWEI